MTKVSVIIPCYNSQDLIGETLDSVLAQTYSEIEIVCVNDGSKDDTLAVLNKYAEEYPDKIKVLDIPNGGAPAARNKGLAFATGELINFTDADDVMDPQKIELQVAAFDDTIDMVFTDYQFKDFQLKNVLRTATFSDSIANPLQMAITKVISTMGPLYRKNAVEGIGGYTEGLAAAQDWEFNLKLILTGASIKHIPKLLHIHREVEHSISADWHKVSKIQCGLAFQYKKELEQHANFNSTIANYLSTLHYNTLIFGEWDDEIWKELNHWRNGKYNFIQSGTKRTFANIFGLKRLINIERKRNKR